MCMWVLVDSQFGTKRSKQAKQLQLGRATLLCAIQHKIREKNGQNENTWTVMRVMSVAGLVSDGQSMATIFDDDDFVDKEGNHSTRYGDTTTNPTPCFNFFSSFILYPTLNLVAPDVAENKRRRRSSSNSDNKTISSQQAERHTRKQHQLWQKQQKQQHGWSRFDTLVDSTQSGRWVGLVGSSGQQLSKAQQQCRVKSMRAVRW